MQTIQSTAIIAVLYTVCINGLLPPVGFGTSQLFYLIWSAAALAVVTLVTVLIAKGKPTLKINILDVAIVITLVWMAISASTTEIRQDMLYAKFALLTTMYISLRVMITYNRRVIEVNSCCLLILGICQIVIAIMQLWGDTASNHSLFYITGSFHNPAPLGCFLAMVSGIALYNIFIKPTNTLFDKIIKLISYVVIAFSLLLLPITQSRIAWVAALIVFAAVVILRYGANVTHWIKSNKAFSVAFSIVALALIIVGCAFAYGMKKDSADGRLLMWKTATSIIADNPTCGIGLGTYDGAAGEYQSKYFADGNASEQEIQVAGSSGSAFNEYLQCGAEMGIIGLCLMLTVAVLAFMGLLKGNSGFQFALLALMIFAIASYPLSLTSFAVIGVVMLSVAASEWQAKIFEMKKWRIVALTLVIVVVNITAITASYPKLDAYKQWGKRQYLVQTGYYKQLNKEYEDLALKLSHEPHFGFEYGKILNGIGNYNQSNEILLQVAKVSADPMIYNIIGNNYKQQKLYAQAEQSYYRAFYAVPNKIYSLYLLAQLYHDSNQVVKLNEMVKRVLSFREKVPSAAVKEIKANVRQLIN